MPEALRGVVDADLLLRWHAECYAAVGYAQEDALVLGVVINRLSQVLGAEHVIPRVVAELEALGKGEGRSSAHEILTMRDALDAGVHSAALAGWASIEMVTKEWGDALVSFLPHLVNDHLCSIALRHSPKGSVICSAAPPFEDAQPSVVEVPVDSVGVASIPPESLSSLVHSLGIPLRVPKVARGVMQVLFIEPERENLAWSLARLAHNRLGLNSHAIWIQPPVAARAIPISADLQTLVKSVARQRGVFDPFIRIVGSQ
jgi:hypothetical protein